MRILVFVVLLSGCSVLTDALVGQVAKNDPLLSVDTEIENADGDIKKALVVGESTSQEVAAETVGKVVGEEQTAQTIVNEVTPTWVIWALGILAVLCLVFWEMPRFSTVVQHFRKSSNGGRR